ncbi:MAG: Gmad2 immunoglobulin-like domain-containing protein [Candidatus Paceibacterota bacterium]
MNKESLIWTIAGFLAGFGFYFIFQNLKQNPPDNPKPAAQVNNFVECAAVYPVMESYPRQCNAPDGKHFVEDIGNANGLSDLIVVDSPRPGDTVKSPLAISGNARGNWYFEASFPVKIVDANDQQLGIIPAQAQGEWMTENFVPFNAVLEFTAPTTPTGSLILQKDNPSGLPENNNQLAIPVKF